MSPTQRHDAGAPEGRGGQFRTARKSDADPRVKLEHPEDTAGTGTAPEVDSQTVSQLRELLSPDQPASVRRPASINAFYHRGLAAAAAHDTDALVRANALYAPDLPESDRSRIASDPQVRELMAVITR